MMMMTHPKEVAMRKLDPVPHRLLHLSLAFVLTLVAFTGTASAQQSEQKPAVEPTPETMAVQDIALARQLMLYGHRTQTPEPYIAAARIMIETPITDPQYERRAEGGTESDKEGVPGLNLRQLLASARELAGDDANLQAVIDELEASQTKERVGGPGMGNDRIEAYEEVWYEVAYHGGRTALFEVIGDGDTDLDCWVYDEYENLVASDTDYTDHCVLMWTPPRTGAYYIKVYNLGNVWNGVVLSTN
jgi:hypothetical protein